MATVLTYTPKVSLLDELKMRCKNQTMGPLGCGIKLEWHSVEHMTLLCSFIDTRHLNMAVFFNQHSCIIPLKIIKQSENEFPSSKPKS